MGAEGPSRQARPSLLRRKGALISPLEINRDLRCPPRPPSPCAATGACPAWEEAQVPPVGHRTLLHQEKEMAELGKNRPSIRPLSLRAMSERNSRAAASAGHGRSIRLPRAMGRENSKAEAG